MAVTTEGREASVKGIKTCEGWVDPRSVGKTLIHEHVLWDLTCRFSELPGIEGKLGYEPVTPQNIEWVRSHPYNNRENLVWNDEAAAANELARFRSLGGDMVVEVSSQGIGRDPEALRRVARAAGVRMVVGCGYYVEASHPERVLSMSVDELTEEMVREIRVGIGETDICAGVIGEIGCSNPLSESEMKCLRAAVQTQAETGAALIIHSPDGDQGPFVLADFLADIEADTTKVILSHLDARLRSDVDAYVRLAERGFCLGLDTFGRDFFIAYQNTKLPDDSVRIRIVEALCERGLVGRFVISQDICLRMELSSYHGRGYDHILRNVVSRLLEAGIDEPTLHAILCDTPVRLLAMPAA